MWSPDSPESAKSFLFCTSVDCKQIALMQVAVVFAKLRAWYGSAGHQSQRISRIELREIVPLTALANNKRAESCPLNRDGERNAKPE